MSLMKTMLDNIWVVIKRLIIAIGPALLGLLFGMFMAAWEALKSLYITHQPLNLDVIWTVGGGAAFAYFLLKVFSLNNNDWIRAFMMIANVVMTPREALEAAAEQVKPLRSVDHIEEKVMPQTTTTTDPATTPGQEGS
jgi:hypothetical protein